MILVISGVAGAGLEVPIRRGITTIGRGADNDIDLHEAAASPQQAELRRFGEQWYLVDLGSSSGTFVDGKRLQAGQPCLLRPGVDVVIGQTHWHLEDRAAGEPVQLAPLPVRRSTDPATTRSLRDLVRGAGRVLAALAAGLLLAGGQSAWLRFQVNLPLLGNVADIRVGGVEAGNGGLLLAAALLALILLVLDVLAPRWGTAAGIGEALLALMAALSLGFTTYIYYRAATQQVLGVSIQSLLSQVAPDAVIMTVQPGLIMVAAGLLALLAGGILRAVAAQGNTTA